MGVWYVQAQSSVFVSSVCIAAGSFSLAPHARNPQYANWLISQLTPRWSDAILHPRSPSVGSLGWCQNCAVNAVAENKYYSCNRIATPFYNNNKRGVLIPMRSAFNIKVLFRTCPSFNMSPLGTMLPHAVWSYLWKYLRFNSEEQTAVCFIDFVLKVVHTLHSRQYYTLNTTTVEPHNWPRDCQTVVVIPKVLLFLLFARV